MPCCVSVRRASSSERIKRSNASPSHRQEERMNHGGSPEDHPSPSRGGRGRGELLLGRGRHSGGPGVTHEGGRRVRTHTHNHWTGRSACAWQQQTSSSSSSLWLKAIEEPRACTGCLEGGGVTSAPSRPGAGAARAAAPPRWRGVTERAGCRRAFGPPKACPRSVRCVV